MFAWAVDIPVRITPKLFSICKESAIQWYQYFRDICSHRLNAIHEGGFKLGGRGHIVQIDESLLVKRKYQRGRLVPEKWIFGMYDTTLRFGIAVFVDDRKKETLLPLIQKYVAPQTTIWSDEWRAYRNIPALPEHYRHGTVNHR